MIQEEPQGGVCVEELRIGVVGTEIWKSTQAVWVGPPTLYWHLSQYDPGTRPLMSGELGKAWNTDCPAARGVPWKAHSGRMVFGTCDLVRSLKCKEDQMLPPPGLMHESVSGDAAVAVNVREVPTGAESGEIVRRRG